MSIKKTIYLITMTLILCIMTLGYAALQERIDVEVEASIDSTYRVEITRVQEGTVVGDARSVQVPSYHDLTSTFNVGLTNDTDYITYTIEITNYSTVDIRLNNTEITTTNNNISFVKSGIRNGDIMLAGSTKTVTIKIKLDTETVGEQTGTITLMFDFTRLRGGVGEVQEDSNNAPFPLDYKECEYLESTGTQYIDTGYIPKTNTKIELDVKFSGTFNPICEYIFSSTNFVTSAFRLNFGSSVIYHDHKLFPWIDIPYENGGVSYGFYIDDVIIKNKNTITMQSQLITYGNTQKVIPTKTADNDNDLIIFGGYEVEDGSICSFTAYNMFLYSLKLYEGYELVRDFIPALDNNDVPCLYDTVTGETFYNQGTGDFLYQLKQ